MTSSNLSTALYLKTTYSAFSYFKMLFFLFSSLQRIASFLLFWPTILNHPYTALTLSVSFNHSSLSLSATPLQRPPSRSQTTTSSCHRQCCTDTYILCKKKSSHFPFFGWDAANKVIAVIIHEIKSDTSCRGKKCQRWIQQEGLFI